MPTHNSAQLKHKIPPREFVDDEAEDVGKSGTVESLEGLTGTYLALSECLQYRK